MLLLLPASGSEPWQLYIAMPVIGAIVQLIAQTRRFRVAGFVMTILGIVIIILILKDEAKYHQRALRTMWEAERKQAEQGGGHVR